MNADKPICDMGVLPMPAAIENARRGIPFTLWLGLFIILLCEVLLFADVLSTGRAPVKTDAQILDLPDPQGLLATLGRFVAPNMTPFAWFGFMFFMDGVLRSRAAARFGGGDITSRCWPLHRS